MTQTKARESFDLKALDAAVKNHKEDEAKHIETKNNESGPVANQPSALSSFAKMYVDWSPSLYFVVRVGVPSNM